MNHGATGITNPIAPRSLKPEFQADEGFGVSPSPTVWQTAENEPSQLERMGVVPELYRSKRTVGNLAIGSSFIATVLIIWTGETRKI